KWYFFLICHNECFNFVPGTDSNRCCMPFGIFTIFTVLTKNYSDMVDIDKILINTRLGIIEEILCQKTDFRNSYLEAIQLLSSIVKDRGGDNSEEISSALQEVVTRINKVPPKM